MTIAADACDARTVRAEAQPGPPRWFQHGPVHCALDFNLANVTLIETNGGYVAIDCGPSTETAAEVQRQFLDRSGSDRLHAIIYTHSHPDHIRGASAWHQSETPIWAQAGFAAELALQNKLPAAYMRRAAKQFGAGLPADIVPHNGIGPRLDLGVEAAAPILYPTDTFDDFAALDHGDLHLQLHAAPGETHDHLFVWIPELKLLHAGDNFYRAFPNLYSIRGVAPRPVERWIASLDAMRRLSPAPECLILGHTEPIVGADRIAQVLTDYRDAIAFVHDSVVRGINDHKAPEQLVAEIQLPPRLARQPFLAEHYGTVRGAVRGIYDGYLGWFDGQAAHLDPLPRRDLAERLAPRLGGRVGMLEALQAALDQGDLPWAEWLGDHLLALDPRDKQAAELLAQTETRLADAEPNPLMHSWRLSDAAELRGQFHPPKKPKVRAATIAHVPIDTLISVFPSRVNPVRSARVNLSIGFDLTDSDRRYTFTIRQGVGEVAPQLLPGANLTIRTTEAELKRVLIAGEVTPLSRDFWRSLKFDVAGPAVLKPFHVLRHLARFASCMIKA
ncbi:MAG: MBL fold metallo-hydrolase [Planctomycetales bacterium]|nr:MBL fold metallo-hydrolase [Planctomycetales bacterium]